MLIYNPVRDEFNTRRFASIKRDCLRELGSPDISEEEIAKDIMKLLFRQSHYRCIELLYFNYKHVGALSWRIDQPDDKDFKRIGDCCIKDFYISSEHRRKGYGSDMFKRIRNLMKDKGVPNIYLTAAPESSYGFWISQGFEKTDEICPDSGLPILIYNVK